MVAFQWLPCAAERENMQKFMGLIGLAIIATVLIMYREVKEDHRG